MVCIVRIRISSESDPWDSYVVARWDVPIEELGSLVQQLAPGLSSARGVWLEVSFVDK